MDAQWGKRGVKFLAPAAVTTALLLVLQPG